MTNRWDEEDLAIALTNPDVKVMSSNLPARQVKPALINPVKPDEGQRGNPLPRFAKAVELESENDFLSWVIGYAHLKGWRVAHFRPAMVIKKGEISYRTAVSADGKGFPDLVLTRNKDIFFVELKSQKGKLTLEQKAWLDAFDKNPTVECFVWRPSDREQIEEILR